MATTLGSVLHERWTYRLIPIVTKWGERKHGEIDHYLAQVLSGHGCFRKYQHRFKIDSDPSCPTCHPVDEDVEHVIFQCPRFCPERKGLEQILGQRIRPDNLIDLMVVSQEKWNAVSEYCATIIKKLRLEERARKSQQQT